MTDVASKVASLLAMIPPPPAGPVALGVIPDPDATPAATIGPEALPSERSQPRRRRPRGRRFAADLEIAELDDRGRPCTSWMAKARSLSGSNIVFHSRRMVYIHRVIVIMVHMVDEEPVALLAKVHTCDYDSEGLCRVDADLLAIPEEGPVARGIAEMRKLAKSLSESGRGAGRAPTI